MNQQNHKMEKAFTEPGLELNNNNVDMASNKIEKLIKLQLLKYARRRRLKSKSGYYIEIRKDGSVRGTLDPSSPYTSLQVMSIGSDMFAIWGSAAELYLSVDPDGTLKTSTNEGRQCVLIESLAPDFYSIYETYHSVFVGEPRCLVVKDNGELGLNQNGVLPGRNGQFIWEIN